MSPTQADQISRIIQLDGPVYDVALVVLHVKINLAMGIGPRKSRNDSLQGDPPRKIVSLRSVVCRDWATKHQKGSSQGNQGHQSSFHLAPPRLKTYHCRRARMKYRSQPSNTRRKVLTTNNLFLAKNI